MITRGIYMYPCSLEEAKQLSDRSCQIVCAAIAGNISIPDPNHIDKSTASVIYAFNHPEVFQSQEDHDMFLDFIGMVFAQPAFVIS